MLFSWGKERSNIDELYLTSLQFPDLSVSFGLRILFYEDPALAVQAALGISDEVLKKKIEGVHVKIYFTEKQSEKDWQKLVTTNTFGISISTAKEEFGVDYRERGNNPDVETYLSCEEIDGKDTKELEKLLKEKLSKLIKEKRKELKEKDKKSSGRFTNRLG